MSAGGGSCGVTLDNIAYCWHDSGSVPVKVPASRSAMTIRGLRLVEAIALAMLTACSDGPGGLLDNPLADGFVVSDPVTTPVLAAESRVASARAGSATDDAVYVSLAPGTVLAGRDAIIHRVGDVGSIFTTVFDGGFDPVPVAAQPGDSIEVRVQDAAGATLFEARRAVADGRAPVVVRTSPARGKTDVAVNASIVIVFSEPVAASSLTASSVRLFRGTTSVAGTVLLLQGTGAAIAFTPDTPLDRNTGYRFVVTRAVRDLDGDALAAGVTMEFTTGQSSTGPAASITVSPDTVYLTGATYQMTATVRDAAGTMLIDQPVTWSTSDPAGLSVSPTGLLTALASGTYGVAATVDGVGGSAVVYVTPGAPASIAVSPTQATVGAAGDTVILIATTRDAEGRLLDHPSVAWTSSDPAVATVAADSSSSLGRAFATVTGVSLGSITITASSGTASGTAAVTVTAPLPVASVTVTPASAGLVVQGTRQLSATVRDANGKALAGRQITWATDNAAVATVDANGLVTGVSEGVAAVTATSEGVSDTAAITVTLLSFASVTLGGASCGLTSAGAAYCWGANDVGQLGVGTATGPETCRRFGADVPCSTLPVGVTGGLTFSALSAGSAHTCGLATGGGAYCWGANSAGQLGTGSSTGPEQCGDSYHPCSTRPVAVAGGLRFSSVSAGGSGGFGGEFTCGLTTAGAAYCWGANQFGQLGDGTTTDRPTPVTVLGGLTFSTVSAGYNHACGVAANSVVYCWGANAVGQLGTGGSTGPEQCVESYPCSMTPVAVTGGLTFSAVVAGPEFTCGLTTTGAAYCWGSNRGGQLGTGSITGPECDPNFLPCSTRPVAVTGGLTFSALSVGFGSCGLVAGGGAYCWGGNSLGQLGTGSATGPDDCGFGASCSTKPVAVVGGLTFAALSSSGAHVCGVTVGSIAYCWGSNGSGELGIGSNTGPEQCHLTATLIMACSTSPVKVAGQP